ncbi:MAG: CbtA family protein [Magnetovibrio sp.]|nr:CbtA family protein [Magnetovibrio sp.]
MLYRIFATAFAAGIIAAALISVLQSFTTTPMILAAETFELPPLSEDEVDTAAEIQRSVFTFMANAVTTIAFALITVVGLTFGNAKPDRTKGLMVAAIGFAAFGLAPAMGMPPKLPGMPVGDFDLRQYWWISTALMTLVGLVCLFVQDKLSLKVLGAILLIAPHIWGAPMPDNMDSDVPATLAANFAANAIVMSAVLWTTLGATTPYFYEKFKPKEV